MDGPKKLADPAPRILPWLVLAVFVSATAVYVASIDESGMGSRRPQGEGTPETASPIKHLVVIVQENHSFDSYFARYCTAKAGSNPTCESGPSCCEAGPATLGKARHKPVVLNDRENMAHDPNHTQRCELLEIDDGRMDGFIANQRCGDPRNFAYATAKSADVYWKLASEGALADRYFQPIVGATSANDMYLARAQYVFTDNSVAPNAIGEKCTDPAEIIKTYDDPTIGDLLTEGGVSWAFYAEGYRVAREANERKACSKPHPLCKAGVKYYPCIYDPSDNPFQYYRSSVDNPVTQRDFEELASDLGSGRLPAVSFVKGLGFRTEHPGGVTIRDGMNFVSGVVDSVLKSRYAEDTLILVTHDESGGYYDHVSPPRTSADGQPYGARIPLIALGKYARKGSISHVQMEHSSIVKFIEWNWLGQTGQLKGRDAAVNNIGSLLDLEMTANTVPVN